MNIPFPDGLAARSEASFPASDPFAGIAADLDFARTLPLAKQPAELVRLMARAVVRSRELRGAIQFNDLCAAGFTRAEVIEFVGDAIASALPPEAEAA